jgi:hypothetical protein
MEGCCQRALELPEQVAWKFATGDRPQQDLQMCDDVDREEVDGSHQGNRGKQHTEVPDPPPLVHGWRTWICAGGWGGVRRDRAEGLGSRSKEESFESKEGRRSPGRETERDGEEGEAARAACFMSRASESRVASWRGRKPTSRL